MGLLAFIIFNFNSTLTNRPAQLRVTSKPKIQHDLAFNDSVWLSKNKRNIEMYQNLWDITVETYLEIYNHYICSHRTNIVSYGTFLALKPFRIFALHSNRIHPCVFAKSIFNPGEELVQLLNYVTTQIFHLSLMIMKASSSTFRPNVRIVIMEMCIFDWAVLQLNEWFVNIKD